MVYLIGLSMTAFTDHIISITVVTTSASDGTIELIAEIITLVGIGAYSVQNMYWIVTLTELTNSIGLFTNTTTASQAAKEERRLLYFFIVFILCLLANGLLGLLTHAVELDGIIVTTILSCMFLVMIIIFLV